jgi:uncharacterized protein
MDMMEEATPVASLDPETGQVLVVVARESLNHYLSEGELRLPDLANLPEATARPGATFVTLTHHGRLRGCMGHTQARFPLAVDAAENAVAAASRDPRFVPVDAMELDEIRLEVTVLTPMRPLEYESYADLRRKIRPGVDGLMLSLGRRQGLLLPQVWERIPDPDDFLDALAYKAGISQREMLQEPPIVAVHTFQVQFFMEEGYQEPGG